MKYASITIAFMLSLCFSPNTYALNDREQGMVIGAFIAGILFSAKKEAPEPTTQQHIIIIKRSPCFYRPLYNDRGVYLGQKFECRYD